MSRMKENENCGLEEIARRALQKDAEYCYKETLEAVPHKTAAILLLTSHHMNHPSEMGEIYWLLLGK